MPHTLISLGANLGNVRETMKLAQQMLQDEFQGDELRFSRLYRTPPVGGPDGQGDFLNGIVALRSDRDAWSIWESVKRVEAGLGRHRLHRWEARRIDVDVLLHDQETIWTPHFKVPHPRMCMRSFMLIPALEVAADWVEPVSGWTIQQLAGNLNSPGPIAIATPSPKLESALKARIESVEIQNRIHWVQLPNTDAFRSALLEGADWLENAKLLILAIDNQDPETIQWEDWSRDWALTLSMYGNWRGAEATTEELQSDRLIGPRYLLPANDVPWAAHEISSAYEAMHCSIDLCA